MKKKILLLGGTGAMGMYLAPELSRNGCQVYITSRKKHESEDADIFYLEGNAKNMDFTRQILEMKFDAIVDFMIYSTEEFRERYQLLLGSTDHYLFLSSYRVYGDNHGKPITEDSPRLLDYVQDAEYLKTDEYALKKARQENILRQSGYHNWTIIRPAITYSKTRFQLGTLEAADFVKRTLEGKPVIFPTQMAGKQATLTWAGDVAKMIYRLMFNEKAMEEAFTVSTSEHHTWQEIIAYYQKIIGLQVCYVDLQVYEDIIGGPYQIKYDRMLDRVIDNSKILSVTGLSQSDLLPLETGLTMELQQFRTNPSYTGFNAARDKKTDAAVAGIPVRTKPAFWAKLKARLRKLLR